MGQLSKKCQARGGLFSVTVGEKKHQNIFFFDNWQHFFVQKKISFFLLWQIVQKIFKMDLKWFMKNKRVHSHVEIMFKERLETVYIEKEMR